MMERRLKLASELLKPENSVLIVTIDEKEYLRLGLLLEQLFPGARLQMVTVTINPRAGVARAEVFTRVDEYIFFVQFGDSKVGTFNLSRTQTPEKKKSPIWFSLMRTGTDSAREDSSSMFYPIWLTESGELHSVGESIPLGKDRLSVLAPSAKVFALWPLRPDGTENRWQLGPETLRRAFQEGTARINKRKNKITVNYLRNAEKQRIKMGDIEVLGKDDSGALLLRHREGAVKLTRPKTTWNSPAHDAGLHGSQLLRSLLPTSGRSFPFPKSLYAVEDCLRFFVGDNKSAIILDYFSGSGTTAHAVMRLNKQDGGRRQCISITNNEVAASEQSRFRKEGLRPGDRDWEKRGICDYITKPRIQAAITGKTPEGGGIAGQYKFNDEFPITEGFMENAEFFTLSYESPVVVRHNRAFERIAPLLWLRAGSEGRCIDQLPEKGWDVADTYGLLVNLDRSSNFFSAIKKQGNIRFVYIVTDDDHRFQAVAGKVPGNIEPVRLYESYLSNFRFSVGGR